MPNGCNWQLACVGCLTIYVSGFFRGNNLKMSEHEEVVCLVTVHTNNNMFVLLLHLSASSLSTVSELSVESSRLCYALPPLHQPYPWMSDISRFSRSHFTFKPMIATRIRQYKPSKKIVKLYCIWHIWDTINAHDLQNSPCRPVL